MNKLVELPVDELEAKPVDNLMHNIVNLPVAKIVDEREAKAVDKTV